MNNASANNMAQMQMQQMAQMQNTAQKVNAAADGWKCECGAVNSGKFCGECGKPAPKAEWFCQECGTKNTGKFCQECGKARG